MIASHHSIEISVVLPPAVHIKRRGTFLFRMKMVVMIDDEIPALAKD